MHTRLASLVVAALLASACDSNPTVDAGTDAGPGRDAGGDMDAGPVDAGDDRDAGAEDDAGDGTDAGDVMGDAGTPDAGPMDAGEPDAGEPDAGEPDAGSGRCSSNADCGRSRLCLTPDGMCGAGGMCEVRPLTCPPARAPVCGCDGTTYDNECLARQAGASVRAPGACLPAGGCFTDADCSGAGEFCQRPDGMCGAPVGTCFVRPRICPRILNPVCACDGTTYDNPCLAAAAGQSVNTAGPCTAGCRSNADCLAGEFCETPDGMCGATGTCATRPGICSAIFAPVCGCDGMTYSNDCVARASGQSVDTVGACPPPPPVP